MVISNFNQNQTHPLQCNHVPSLSRSLPSLSFDVFICIQLPSGLCPHVVSPMLFYWLSLFPTRPWPVHLSVLYPHWVIPCGIHGRGDKLQKFQMDSMVIPWFFHTDSTLFPHGFHGISRWIPYGTSLWNHNSTLIHKFKPKYWVVWNIGKRLNLIT